MMEWYECRPRYVETLVFLGGDDRERRRPIPPYLTLIEKPSPLVTEDDDN